MLDKQNLRKADVYSGAVISLFGLWIVTQSLKMPMKDSWGGVQNVWFVSPALFPLFVGAIIMILGLVLCRTAFKAIGPKAFGETLRWISSRKLFSFLNSIPNLRFYSMVALFFSFVFVNIPRIDFFLSAVLFLVVFISAFYFDDAVLLKKLFFFYLAGAVALVVFFALGLNQSLGKAIPFPADLLTVCFIIAYCIYVWTLIHSDATLRKKFRTTLIVAFVAPFAVGMVFKYFLLVPMPSEGLVVAVLDYFWYLVF